MDIWIDSTWSFVKNDEPLGIKDSNSDLPYYDALVPEGNPELLE